MLYRYLLITCLIAKTEFDVAYKNIYNKVR